MYLLVEVVLVLSVVCTDDVGVDKDSLDVADALEETCGETVVLDVGPWVVS